MEAGVGPHLIVRVLAVCLYVLLGLILAGFLLGRSEVFEIVLRHSSSFLARIALSAQMTAVSDG